jgi:hypothetical protein
VPPSTPESAGGWRQSWTHATNAKQPVGWPASSKPESAAHVHQSGAQQPSMQLSQQGDPVFGGPAVALSALGPQEKGASNGRSHPGPGLTWQPEPSSPLPPELSPLLLPELLSELLPELELEASLPELEEVVASISEHDPFAHPVSAPDSSSPPPSLPGRRLPEEEQPLPIAPRAPIVTRHNKKARFFTSSPLSP